MISRSNNFILYSDGFGYGRWSLRLSNFSLKKLLSPLMKIASFLSFIDKVNPVKITYLAANKNHYQFDLNEVNDNKGVYICISDCKSTYYNVSKWLANHECNMTAVATKERFYEYYLRPTFVLRIYKAIFEESDAIFEKCINFLIREEDQSENVTQCVNECNSAEEAAREKFRNIFLICVLTCIGVLSLFCIIQHLLPRRPQDLPPPHNQDRLLEDTESPLPVILEEKSEPTFQERLQKIDISSSSESIPEEFFCPISRQIMNDPVFVAETGNTYDRTSISKWLSQHHTDPLTRQKLSSTKLTVNWLIHELIDKFIAKLETEASRRKEEISEKKYQRPSLKD